MIVNVKKGAIVSDPSTWDIGVWFDIYIYIYIYKFMHEYMYV